MRQAHGVALCGALFGILGSCGPAELAAPPDLNSDGVIAEVRGELKKLASHEQETLCSTHYCEPNYLYSASFGKSKPKPSPMPSPSAVPSPDPVTPPPSSPSEPPSEWVGGGKEAGDYSKKVLGLPNAWSLTTGSREIVVAVIDSGVDLEHPDLKNNLWVNEKEWLGTRGVDNDGNGFINDVHGWDFVNSAPLQGDDHKHGTHCAGIIGAELNDQVP